MKIGFDLSMLVYRGSGVATYTFELTKNLLRTDKKNTYIGFYSSLRRPKNFYYLDQLRDLGMKIVDYRFPPTLLRFIWGRYQLVPIERLIGKIDIYHSSDFLRPPQVTARGVTTIHDLTWHFYPQYHTETVVKAHQRKLARTIKYGDEIITVSKAAKDDICRVFKIPEEKIHVIYEGVDQSKFKIPASPDFGGESFDTDVLRTEVLSRTAGRQGSRLKIEKNLKKYRVKKPYLLYVGAVEPRKNLSRLIEAFNSLLQKGFEDLNLVIAGRAGWKNDEVFQLIKRLGLETKVVFTGFVADSDLPTLYQNAKVFAYPSLYEGFGLPILEALASGCPVITSRISSLPEVGGDAVIYIDPNSSNNIASGIIKILQFSQTSLEALKREGQKQAKKFTWEATAKETLKVYEKIHQIAK